MRYTVLAKALRMYQRYKFKYIIIGIENVVYICMLCFAAKKKTKTKQT